MDEKRETAPITPGSAEGERDLAQQSMPSGAHHTPGSAEGERRNEDDLPAEVRR